MSSCTVAELVWYGYSRRYCKCTLPNDIIKFMMSYFDTTLHWKFNHKLIPKATTSLLYFASKPIIMNDITFLCLLYPNGRKFRIKM